MESAEGGEAPPPQSEEAPPPMEEEAPPPPSPGDTAPPPPEEQAPPPTEEGSQPAPEGAAPPTPDTDATPPSGQDAGLSMADYRSLIPSDEELTLTDDAGSSQSRVRPRLAPRPVQSVLSDGISLSQSSRRSSKYHRSMSGLPNLQETLKERQVCR